MGTDIHLVIEERRRDAWFPYPMGNTKMVELFVYRDYEVFSILSGTREGEKPHPLKISDPRGLPDNAHQRTKEFFADGDYHSHSWVYMSEFVNAFPFCGETLELHHIALVVYGMAHDWRYHSDRWRLVFAYDC